MTASLAETLGRVAELAKEALDPWWIIGSAAVALHGGEPPTIGDVDLLMSARDARAFLDAAGAEPLAGNGTPLFRSAVFGRWDGAPLTVEVMADFHVAIDGRWHKVEPVTREAIGDMFVPSRGELVALLRSFGRPKDLARAELLR